MRRSLLLRSAVLQAIFVGVLSTALALALGSRFFTHWGWLVGPLAWLACSLATAGVLSLAPRRTLAGAILAGLPSIAAVAVGLHWLGDLVAIVLFAAWCAWTPAPARSAWSGERAEEVGRTEVPAGRLGTPEEITAAVAFLCSQRASYITGVGLLADGGLSRLV